MKKILLATICLASLASCTSTNQKFKFQIKLNSNEGCYVYYVNGSPGTYDSYHNGETITEYDLYFTVTQLNTTLYYSHSSFGYRITTISQQK